MRVWRLLPQHEPLPPALLDAAGGRPRLARILHQRGWRDPVRVRVFLDPDRYTPTPPAEIPGLEAGVERIEAAICRRERILVWGDFDVDGQTSTALFVSALQDLGADVDFHIPVRARESHGIRPDVLQPYLDAGIGLLLTCDTGIASVEAVARAKAAGVDTVVTDHHDLPSTLPEAFALVNPKFLPPDHPLATLPGVGVAFKVVEALYERAGRGGEFELFLDLVALGLVADLATLTGDARYLLQRGLRALRETRRVGLRAIFERAGIQPETLDEEDIGFGIGPRLNAIGRLADANRSVPLLTTDDRALAETIADELERLNEERRLLTDQVYAAARAQVEADPSLIQYAALVLSHPHWHQGVIGIVASRLVDDFGKPAILLASPPGEPARGSARSVDGYNITEAIASQAALLHGFGGHPMAAGLAIEADRIDRFRVGVSTALAMQRDGAPPDPVLEIALALDLADLTPDLAVELAAAGPFGPGNPPVNVLCTGVEAVAFRAIGKTERHRKATLRSRANDEAGVLWWNSASEPIPEGPIDLAVRLRPGRFRGGQTVDITWQDHRFAGAESPRTLSESVRVEDLRGASDPERVLHDLLAREPGALVWGEVEPVAGGMVGRHALGPAPVLVVWTTPPGQRAVDEALARVWPHTVYVFARNPGVDDVASFLRRLAGVAKYAFEQHRGGVPIERLAAAMAATEIAVREGLSLLVSVGIEAVVERDGTVVFRRVPARTERNTDALSGLILESRAYRRLFEQTTSLPALLDRRP
jgi:single-stranded-DNA-specific exonuclease